MRVHCRSWEHTLLRGEKDMPAITTMAHGLRFPEGPVAMPDGSVVLVEIERQTLSRVRPNGEVSVIATLGGGPNGAAIGPDGRCYVCNNGGSEGHRRGDGPLPGAPSARYHGGGAEAGRPASARGRARHTR